MAQNRQEEKVDRLSLLPDALLHKILNLIDTKVAVEMSFSSHRWMSMWKSLDNLNISRDSFTSLASFSRFVCGLLSGRDNNYPIRSLKLDFGRIDDDDERIDDDDDSWHSIFECVSDRNIKHLDISVSGCDNIILSKRWDFTCPTLKSFILNGSGPPAIVPYLFNPLRLTALESLHIDSIAMPSYMPRMELFSHCSNLKDLTLSNCSMKGLGSFGILGMKLCRLRLLDNSFSVGKDPVVAIWAPKLAYFQYRGSAQACFSFPMIDTLEQVDIYVNAPSTTEMKETAAREMILLLHKLESAKRVVLSSDSIRVIYLVPGLLEHQISPFRNLNELVLKGCQEDEDLVCLEVVTNYFLRSAPNATVIVEPK